MGRAKTCAGSGCASVFPGIHSLFDCIFANNCNLFSLGAEEKAFHAATPTQSERHMKAHAQPEVKGGRETRQPQCPRRGANQRTDNYLCNISPVQHQIDCATGSPKIIN